MRRFLVPAFLSLLLSVAAQAATRTETIDRTVDVRPGANVLLTNVNGKIVVGAWDQPRVRIVAVKEVEADKDEIAAVLRELRVEIQPRDGGVVVTTHYPKRSDGIGSIFDWLLGDHVSAKVQFEVTVPRSMNVEVENTNGTIRVEGVSGRLEADTTNGRIEFARCSGTLEASTTNGAIEAELVSVSKGQPLRLSTTNGRITVSLPSTLGADVDASTTNGSIKTDLPIATTRLDRNSLRGTINGGGTPVRLRTTNGGIEIRVAGKS